MEHKKLLATVFCLSLLFGCLMSGNAEASDEGFFIVKPFKGSATLREGATYNTNIGRADKHNKSSDWGNVLGGGVTLLVPIAELHSYSFNIDTAWTRYFSDSDDFSHTNTVLNQSVDVVFNNWAANIHHSFDLSSDPTTSELAVVENDLLKRKVHRVGGTLFHDFNKMKLTGGVDFEVYRTNTEYDMLERDAYTAYVDTEFPVTAFFGLFARYSFANLDRKFDILNGGNQHTALGGIRGNITKYLVGNAGVGFAYTDYKNNTDTDSKQYRNVVYSGSLTNRISNLTTQSVQFSLNPDPGYSVGNYFTTFDTCYNIMHRLNSKINLNGTAEHMYGKESGNSHFKEKYNIFLCGAGLSYSFAKNLSLGTGYNFSHRNSNRHGKDYTQHAVTAQLSYTI